MASLFSLQLLNPLLNAWLSGSHNRQNFHTKSLHSEKLGGKEPANWLFPRKWLPPKFLFTNYTSSRYGTILSLSSARFDQNDSQNGVLMYEVDSHEKEFNRVNCLVWILHESAPSFSLAVESLELAGSGAELAMAWNGKDVHMWHKRISYQVAVYALLKTAIEVETLLSHDRHNSLTPVRDILMPETNLMGQYIEGQLHVRHSELLQWFRVVELPRIAGYFSPLLKKWCMEYAGSGVAGLIVAISCCAAVGKLGSRRHSCPLFTLSIEDIIVQLMDLAYSLVSVEKLYQLATEAGFELDFLCHFGVKVLPDEKGEELEFWIGLAQEKLSVAFQKENFISDLQPIDRKVQADSLATLGLFAYLGRKTRLYLSRMGIDDLDELVKDFLSYLECGSVFIYPEFSSISVYQFFMEVSISQTYVGDANCKLSSLPFGYTSYLDLILKFQVLGRDLRCMRLLCWSNVWLNLWVLQCKFLSRLSLSTLFLTTLNLHQVVTDEIGWLDLYGAFSCISNQERRRCKHHAIQAEKEIILSTVFTVCYDVFYGFARFNRSTQQYLDAELLAFLIRSQSLLTICLEDYWAAYDRSGELQKIAAGATDFITSTEGTTRFPIALITQQKPSDLMKQDCQQNKPQCEPTMNKQAVSSPGTDAMISIEGTRTSKSNPLHESLIKKYSNKMISTSLDVWMGTQFLFIDIMVSLELLLKQLQGHEVTAREQKKLKRTLSDIASLIPVTILMLLPVSAVGHAAMLAAIRKYVPSLIPSPYSSQRLDVVKQLKRTRKMEIQSGSNLEDPSL